MGDSNNVKGLGFHSVKLNKMWGRGASPEGKAVLHQAVEKNIVGGYEFRCAKEWFCMTKDAQSAAGIGGQLWNVVCPRKIMADSKTQEFECLIFKKVDGAGLPGGPFGEWGCEICQDWKSYLQVFALF